MRAGRSAKTSIGTQMDLVVGDEAALKKYGGAAKAMAWIVGMGIGIWLLGWQIGITMFFIVYLVFRRTRWFMIPILVTIMQFIMFYFDKFLEIFWPQGLLIRWLELPLF